MNIVLFCSAARGLTCLAELIRLMDPNADKLLVFTFKEEAWEPPFTAAISSLAKDNKIPVCVTKSVSEEYVRALTEFNPEVMLFIGWRYLIPSSVYNLASIGAFVFHDSLLPKYRGFSPTVWAMINGESKTGVTLFKISENVDEGDVLAQAEVPIYPEDNIAQVTLRVTDAYVDVLKKAVPELRNVEVSLTQQDHSLATYTCKRIPDDNRIDWSQDNLSIHNLIRAVTKPYTGAYCFFKGEKLFIWEATICDQSPAYVGVVLGRVVKIIPGVGVQVLTGRGVLQITMVSFSNGEFVTADQVIRSITDTLN